MTTQKIKEIQEELQTSLEYLTPDKEENIVETLTDRLNDSRVCLILDDDLLKKVVFEIIEIDSEDESILLFCDEDKISVKLAELLNIGSYDTICFKEGAQLEVNNYDTSSYLELAIPLDRLKESLERLGIRIDKSWYVDERLKSIAIEYALYYKRVKQSLEGHTE